MKVLSHRSAVMVAAYLLTTTACSSNDAWVRGLDAEMADRPVGTWVDAPPTAPVEPPSVRRAPMSATPEATWRNTYYDFPNEEAGPKGAMVYDAACKPVAPVTRTFHDKVCVQGSGKLSSGATISFAKRDCACAAVCPRTDQKICFEKLDPKVFPHGRGAAGTAIIPFRSVAVDSEQIPLGTVLHIPEYRGLKMLDGKVHDGCFVAQDRGLKVVGRHIDVFTGSEAGTVAWNEAVPSNEGVHVVIGAPECRHLAP